MNQNYLFTCKKQIKLQFFLTSILPMYFHSKFATGVQGADKTTTTTATATKLHTYTPSLYSYEINSYIHTFLNVTECVVWSHIFVFYFLIILLSCPMRSMFMFLAQSKYNMSLSLLYSRVFNYFFFTLSIFFFPERPSY